MKTGRDWRMIFLKALGNAIIAGVIIFACISRDMSSLMLTLEFAVLLVGVGLTAVDVLFGKGESDEN